MNPLFQLAGSLTLINRLRQLPGLFTLTQRTTCGMLFSGSCSVSYFIPAWSSESFLQIDIICTVSVIGEKNAEQAGFRIVCSFGCRFLGSSQYCREPQMRSRAMTALAHMKIGNADPLLASVLPANGRVSPYHRADVGSDLYRICYDTC